MHVGIDQPRENCRVAEVINRATHRYLIGSNHGLDALSPHKYGSWPDSIVGDHVTREEGLQAQVVLLRRFMIAAIAIVSIPACTSLVNQHFTKF
jgi:hypothetical protein